MTTALRTFFSVSLAAAVAIGALTLVAYAQEDPTLEDRVATLEGLVETLQTDLTAATDRITELETDLTAANDRIADLEDELEDLKNASSSDSSSDDDDDDTTASDIEGDGTGHILLCHKGKNTIRVGAAAMFAHLAHGDASGACNSQFRYRWHNDSDEDDDDSDDDSDDDD